jgi:hypothetical protein
MITITETEIVELLEECVPYLRFCQGGTDVDELLGRVDYVLTLARKEDSHRSVEGDSYNV